MTGCAHFQVVSSTVSQQIAIFFKLTSTVSYQNTHFFKLVVSEISQQIAHFFQIGLVSIHSIAADCDFVELVRVQYHRRLHISLSWFE